MPRENTNQQRTLITKAPMSREDVLKRINSYYVITGLLPERIMFARDGEKPVMKSVLAYIVGSIDGEAIGNL